MNTQPVPPFWSDSVRRHPWISTFAGMIGLLAAAITGYSIYVANHEPDPQETVILGQTALASGSPAALRVLVHDRVTGAPIAGATVTVSLQDKASQPGRIGRFQTDATGTLTNTLAIPEIPPGDYQLMIATASPLGRDEVSTTVQVQPPTRLLLTSDKPIYQPGQTIHLRSLVRNGRTGKPFASQLVAFEITDPKGNKVFKENHAASAFGMAAADFELATELNPGRYQISAQAGPASAECTVEIKDYVLPKFKTQITTDQSYYLPGQTLSGSVRAGYFFGKPVSGGAVKLTGAMTPAEGSRPTVPTLPELAGQTDADGNYAFHFVLPDFFAGMPQNNGQAFLDLTAQVRDAAGHLEEKTLSLSVARQDLAIAAIPEAGTLVPGVTNRLYILTTHPDGQPAVCQVSVNGARLQTDAQGVGIVSLLPMPTNSQPPVLIEAQDAAGHKSQLTWQPDNGRTPPAFLLRTDKAVYQAGETARISLFSPEKENTVFLDVIQDGQTVLTKSVLLKNFRGDDVLVLPANLVGMLKLNAYVITAGGEDRGCSRLVYVNPASSLHIAGKLSQPVYRPGETAKVEFAVTDAGGHPTPAALGIAAVDESVFALSENRPGLLPQLLDGAGDRLASSQPIQRLNAQVLAGGNQVLAAAWLASLETPHAGLTIEDLVKNGEIPQRLIDHAREMRGTPEYEQLRANPDFAEALRLLEGTQDTYNFRAATGAVKQHAVAAHRRAYFNKLEGWLLAGFFALLFLSPVLLLIYHSRPMAGVNPRGVTDETAEYVRIANSLHHCLALLTIMPFIYYPLGGMLLEQQQMESGVWLLLAFEGLVVVLSLYIQWIRTPTNLHTEASEMFPLRVSLLAFLVQFLVSRGGVMLLVMLDHRTTENVMPFWILASVIAPLVVVGTNGSYIRRQLAAKGIEGPARSGILEILVVVVIVMVLAAMLLPALASAKKKAAKVALVNDLKQIELAKRVADEDGVPPTGAGSSAPRIRRDFPETLLWRPELITDDSGRVALDIPLADSITTWRTSVEGISAAGQLGGLELAIPVFQDFFVDLDLPVSLSLGDQVSVPVACHNYLPEPQDVRLTVANENWFTCPEPAQTVHLAPNEVKSVSLTLQVLRVGTHTLRVTAQGTKTADAIEREIRVVPTGERVEDCTNATLTEAFASTFVLPANAIPDSASLGVKFYPSRFSEVVEGLDGILEEPYGCFEQTSSTTYPNVLVLDYLKRMGRLTPAIELKARKFINTGYQRLLSFEVPGGGFEWFGRAPAHVGLTAYGIMEFTDMSRVQPVDQAMVERTRQWLYSKQDADGSWKSTQGMDEWSGESPVTAYVVWALAESGDNSPALGQGLNFLRTHPDQVANNYQKALAANAFLAHDRTDTFGLHLLNELRSGAQAEGKRTHWNSSGRSLTYSHGSQMEVETTALCALAMMKTGQWPETVKAALTWLAKHKDRNGAWETTQATILAMRALLQGSSAALGQSAATTITVTVNGQAIKTFHLDKNNSDVLQQIDLRPALQTGTNQIQFRQMPAGELPFQLTGSYWLPSPASADASVAQAGPLEISREGGWKLGDEPSPPRPEPLEISLQYDRTRLAVNEPLHCTVTVKNHAEEAINMALVELGIPPGFDVDTAAFEALKESGQIAKFETTGGQVILYLRELSNAAPLQFQYSLRAKYPLRAQTPPSAVYEYYQPQNRAAAKAVRLEVTGRFQVQGFKFQGAKAIG